MTASDPDGDALTLSAGRLPRGLTINAGRGRITGKPTFDSAGVYNVTGTGSVGTSKRDYQTLIAAMRELPEYRIEIYPSSRYFDLYKGDLSQLPEWIKIKPYISQQKLAFRYSNAPFGVLPLFNTTQYSAGVSAALEAASAGKAVVATHTKGMPDYVVDGVTGILVPPGDIQALRHAIRKLKDNHLLAQEMGCNARKYVEEHFDPMNIISSTQQVIRSAIK